MLTRTRTVTAVVVLAALASAMPTAQADVRRFADARNDTSSSVDIYTVRVDNSTSARDKVIVTVRQDNARPGDSIAI